MKFSILFLLIILINSLTNKVFGQVEDWKWVNIIDCDYHYNMTPQIAVDQNSCIFIADNYGYSANFGDTIISSTNGQIFFAKYDSSGSLLWLKEFYTSNNSCDVNSIHISNNSVYLTGHFSDTLLIDNSVLIASDKRDLFIAKFDTSGNFEWAFSEEGEGYETGSSIHSNNNSDIVVCGNFNENIHIGDTTLIADNNTDFFVSKYVNIGQCEWTIHGYGPRTISSAAITYDNLGFVYVTGSYTGSLTVNEYSLTTSAYYSTFVLKIDQSGEIQWLKDFAGMTKSIVVDHENNIYLGVGFDDKYLRKIDSDGNLLWENGNGDFKCKSLAVDDNNNIISVGALTGTEIINNIEYYTDSAYGGPKFGWSYDADILAVKTNESGNVMQVVHVDDYHTEGIGEPQYGWSASSNMEDVFVAGPYKGNAVFNGIDTLSGGGFFIGLLNKNNLQSIVTETKKSEISIFPNPAKESITIKISQGGNESVISILNSSGIEIKRLRNLGVINNLNIQDLEAGIYYIVIDNSINKFVKKFIKL